MAYGAVLYSGAPLGSVLDLTHNAITTPLDFLESRGEEHHVSAPYLQFYELKTKDSQFFRFVDFAHHKAGATADAVTFNGSEWKAMQIQRGGIEEATDGTFPGFTITVLDPLRLLLGFLSTNDGLDDAKITIYIIPHDKLTDTAYMRSATFRVREPSCAQNPQAVTLKIGGTLGIDKQFPIYSFNSRRCHNNFQRRFIHDGVNWCSYPSDEFDLATKQSFDTDIDGGGGGTETELGHGMYVINGDANVGLGNFYSGLPVPGSSSTVPALYHNVNKQNYRWNDANREGAFCYKKIGEVDATDDLNIDVYTRINVFATTVKPQYHIGLIVQDADSLGNWIFWGEAKNASAVAKSRMRKTVSDVSSETDLDPASGPTGFFDTEYRISRSGTNWTFYSRYSDVTSQSNSTEDWRQRTTTTATMSGMLNVGVVFASDDTAATQPIVAAFYFLRFLAGGAITCNRLLANCEARKNRVQFNAFLTLPRGIPS